jgi:hypothetical protein
VSTQRTPIRRFLFICVQLNRLQEINVVHSVHTLSDMLTISLTLDQKHTGTAEHVPITMRLLWLNGAPHLFAMVVAHGEPEGLERSCVLEGFIDDWLLGYLRKNVRFSTVRYDVNTSTAKSPRAVS